MSRITNAASTVYVAINTATRLAANAQDMAAYWANREEQPDTYQVELLLETLSALERTVNTAAGILKAIVLPAAEAEDLAKHLAIKAGA